MSNVVVPVYSGPGLTLPGLFVAATFLVLAFVVGLIGFVQDRNKFRSTALLLLLLSLIVGVVGGWRLKASIASYVGSVSRAFRAPGEPTVLPQTDQANQVGLDYTWRTPERPVRLRMDGQTRHCLVRVVSVTNDLASLQVSCDGTPLAVVAPTSR